MGAVVYRITLSVPLRKIKTMPDLKPAEPELVMTVSGLDRIDGQLDILSAYWSGLREQVVSGHQWDDLAEFAASVRGVWRGVEATVAPFINPANLATRRPGLDLPASWGERENLWRELHVRMKVKMDRLDRACLDHDLPAVDAASGAVRAQLDKTREVVARVELMSQVDSVMGGQMLG